MGGGAQTLKKWGSKGWGPERVGPGKGGAPKGWGPERVGPRKGGAPKGWGPERVGAPNPRKSGAPKGWGPERVGPRRVGGQNFALFLPFPATVSLFLCLSGGLFVEFWWCF